MMRRSWLVLTAVAALAVPLARAEEKKVEVRVERDVVYGKGGDVELKLDLALPQDGDGPFPAVLCIHGGGWRGGKRQDMSQTIGVLAARGYVAVTPSYRLVPAAAFPAQIEDCKAAVRWLRANAKQYKVNPERVAALGFSAGGHLSCLLGTSDKNDGLEGNGGNPEQSSRVQAVVSFFGPTDFSRRTWTKQIEEGILVPFLGGSFDDKKEMYEKASPIKYVTSDDPPFLFFHGSADQVVSVEQSKILAEKLRAAGVAARVEVLDGAGHGWGGEQLKKTVEQMVAFLDERLKK